jgi:hypothetical protein
LREAVSQATRTWVSGVGDDANPCSRTAPCKTFAGAISKTAAAGEINCLDSGGFGAITITKSIAIICEGVVGGILGSGTNGVNVNGAGVTVYLSGLDIEGGGTGLNGVNVLQGNVVTIHKTTIRGFGASNNSGVKVAPASGTTLVAIVNSIIVDSPSGAAPGSGVLVAPTGSGSVNLTIDNTQINNNGGGVRADGSTSTGTIRGVLRGVTISGNARSGILANSNGPVVRLLVDNSSMSFNPVGVTANGAGAAVALTRSAVTHNTTGLSVGGGIIQSYGDNEIDNNPSGDGPAPTPIAHR